MQTSKFPILPIQSCIEYENHPWAYDEIAKHTKIWKQTQKYMVY